MPVHRSRSAWIIAALFLPMLLVSKPVPADEPEDAIGPLPSDPYFSALLTDTTTIKGQIRQLGPGAELVLVEDSGEDRTVPLEQLVKLTREGVSVSYPPEGSLIWFAEGDRLRALIDSADDESIQISTDRLGTLSVPIEAALGLILTLPADPEPLLELIDRIRNGSRTSDVLWLTNGDRLSGTFLSLGPRQVAMESETGRVELETGDVRAVGFDPTLGHYPRPEGLFLELTLTDGSRLGVQDARIDRSALRATTRFGEPVEIPLRLIARMHTLGGTVVYLTEREPAGAQYVPYVGPVRPFQRDASVLGRPLRLAGEHYERGLGTESRTLLAYRLEPGDRRFQALVGLDDQAGPLGSAVLKVMVDGEVQFASPPLTVDDAPIAVDVDVSEASLLILMTEFGDRGGIRDYANWVEARLVR